MVFRCLIVALPLSAIEPSTRARSLVIGFALSILGSILLFLGQLGSFAGGNFERVTTRLPILLYSAVHYRYPRISCWYRVFDRGMLLHSISSVIND